MKILVISTFPPLQLPDADYAYRLSRNIADAGHEVHVLCQEGSIAGDVPRLHTHALMKHWGWREALPLASSLRRLAPDAVLLVYTGNAFLHRPMLTFAASITKRVLPRVRFVTLIPFPLGANMSCGLSGRFHRLIIRMHGRRANAEYGTLLHDSAHLVVMSTKHLPNLERHLPNVREKFTLIPPALIMPMASEDKAICQQTRTSLGVKDDEFLFAFFGYLYATKGLETLVPAFHMLRQRRKRVKLVLIGGGDGAKGDGNPFVSDLKRRIRELGLTDAVQFTGGFPWDSDQGSKYLRAADAAVLPFDHGVSLNNSSFASVVAHGLPTITTRGEVLEPPIVHGCNTLLCGPQDADALASAMETVASDDNLRSDLRAGALELALTCFSWRSATDSFISCLAEAKLKAPKPTL